jgi:hypothetical protein
MNPKTTTAVILALLVHNGTMTEDEAQTLLNKAGESFAGYNLDDFGLAELVGLLNGEPVEQAERSQLETIDTPKLILPE